MSTTVPYRCRNERVIDGQGQEAGACRAILALPGSMFVPSGDPASDRSIRLAFANINQDGIAALTGRLRNMTP